MMQFLRKKFSVLGGHLLGIRFLSLLFIFLGGVRSIPLLMKEERHKKTQLLMSHDLHMFRFVITFTLIYTICKAQECRMWDAP